MKIINNIWFRLSIKRKLMLFFSLIIVCISFLNIYTLINAFKYLKIYEQDLIKNTAIHNLQTSIIENNVAFENYIMYSDKNSLNLFNNKIPEIWSNWSHVYETSKTNRLAYYQISAIKYAFLAYIESANKTLEYKEISESSFIDHLLKTRRINGYIERYFKDLVQIRLEEGSQLHSVQINRVIVIRTISFLGIILISVLFLFFGTFFSSSVTKPIRELAARSLKMAEGNLKASHFNVPYKDEIGVLTNSFNKMSTNINEMIKSLEEKVEIEKKLHEDEVKIIEMNRSLKEAQFLSLQSQISPHFLFNTLNIISRTSMFEKAPKTIKLIESLSNIFRYTLNKQNRIVPLNEEINILIEYMYIQKIRYGERLSFKVICDFDLSCINIPIFTLQPLIENAIKYGIEPKEEGGSITLIIEQVKKAIRLKIEDTGIGIPQNMIEKILSNDEQILSSESTGIGISNVKRRLNIVSHGKGSFDIQSDLGKGTTIIIIIPGEESV
ncbi:MAG: histidine kinase [Bacteroidetes bacterium]|nr:histidine kinase [Bacteroidota bacterium]